MDIKLARCASCPLVRALHRPNLFDDGPFVRLCQSKNEEEIR
jgi:hypothetical protein